MKRTLPLIITFLAGIFMMAELFVPSWRYRTAFGHVQEWGIVLIAGAYLLGLVNLLQVNVPIIVRRESDWGYKLILVLSLVFTLAAGFAGGEHRSDPGATFDWLNRYLFDPLNATMFALLAFFIASAAFRAFRARNFEATLLLLTAVFVMFARVPLGELASQSLFGDNTLQWIMGWILDVPNNAAKRAILVGAALGAVATGLRVILGLDRSHLGS